MFSRREMWDGVVGRVDQVSLDDSQEAGVWERTIVLQRYRRRRRRKSRASILVMAIGWFKEIGTELI